MKWIIIRVKLARFLFFIIKILGFVAVVTIIVRILWSVLNLLLFSASFKPDVPDYCFMVLEYIFILSVICFLLIRALDKDSIEILQL